MDFACPRPSAPVLIVSYETFRNYKEYLYGEGKVDMLICDEVSFNDHNLEQQCSLSRFVAGTSPQE